MITDYASLQQTVYDWSHRADNETLIKVPDFVYLAETKIANNIRSRKLEVTSSYIFPISATSFPLPSDYGSMKSIYIEGAGNGPLTLISTDNINNLLQNGYNSGPLSNYAIQGDEVLLYPLPGEGTVIKFTYYKDLQNLTSVNTTNWVLDKYPYVYLYGSLIELNVFTDDPDQVTFYETKFNSAISDMWANYTLESFGSGPLRVTNDYIV